MNITLDTTKGLGFGDMLCMLSMLTDLPEPVTLFSNNRETYYDRLKGMATMLRIPESRLKIMPTDEEGDFSGAYHLKTLSNYYYPDYLIVDGKRIRIAEQKQNKGFIGLCVYNGDGYIDSNWNFWRNNEQQLPVNEGSERTDRIPQCKWRTIDYYSQVFAMLRRCGYEVITLDQHGNLETKIRFLAENCAAVVGYEGGMAHLCHMLKIPFMMFKYRPSPDIDDLYGPFTQEVTHQSRTVYFIDDDERFINFTKRDMEQIINNLNQQQHNNRIVKGEVKMVFDNGVNSRISFVDQAGNVLYKGKFGPQVSDKAAEIINWYYRDKLNIK